MSLDVVEKQARYLAQENKKSNPDVQEIYWFPDVEEVRLVELTEEIPVSDDGMAHPYYFKAAPDYQLPQPSGIALMRPNEFGQVQLPANWGGWKNALKLEVAE